MTTPTDAVPSPHPRPFLLVQTRPEDDAAAAEVDEQTADDALRAAGGESKVAIVALLTGAEPADARARLAAADGRVRAVVEPRAE